MYIILYFWGSPKKGGFRVSPENAEKGSPPIEKYMYFSMGVRGVRGVGSGGPGGGLGGPNGAPGIDALDR